jgi:hypothetical protein
VPDRPRKTSPNSHLPTKPCAVCGRSITWRKKWERDWDNIRFCSDACRRAGVSDTDAALELAILRLLRELRSADATICPSQAAIAVAGSDPGAWRPLMEPAKAGARRLVEKGAIEITQAGRVVDPSTARGPIRLRLRRQGR